jgi:hypothetical protein
MGLRSWIKGFFEQKWPDGEPLVAGGVRWGTKLPDGSIVGGENVRIEAVPICSLCHHELHDGRETE